MIMGDIGQMAAVCAASPHAAVRVRRLSRSEAAGPLPRHAQLSPCPPQASTAVCVPDLSNTPLPRIQHARRRRWRHHLVSGRAFRLALLSRDKNSREKYPNSRLFFFPQERWEGLQLVGKRGASTGMGSTQYGDIKLGSKDGGTLGTLKCRSEGLVWESQVRRSRLLARQWACARLACACSGAPTGVRLRAPTPCCRPPAVRARI